jgi:hypothetical protein
MFVCKSCKVLFKEYSRDMICPRCKETQRISRGYNAGDRFICKEYPNISLILEAIDHFTYHPRVRYVLSDYKHKAINIELSELALYTYFRRTRKGYNITLDPNNCYMPRQEVTVDWHKYKRTDLNKIPDQYKQKCEGLFEVAKSFKYKL